MREPPPPERVNRVFSKQIGFDAIGGNAWVFLRMADDPYRDQQRSFMYILLDLAIIRLRNLDILFAKWTIGACLHDLCCDRRRVNHILTLTD